MRSTDFTPESPGRLVEIPTGVQAFVPDPLPDELALDHVVIRVLTDAEQGVVMSRASGADSTDASREKTQPNGIN